MDRLTTEDKWSEKLTWILSSDDLKIQYLVTKRVYDLGISPELCFVKLWWVRRKQRSLFEKEKEVVPYFLFLKELFPLVENVKTV